jgi:hypothetical protein
MQGDRLHDAVALVQDRDDRHPLRHRRNRLAHAARSGLLSRRHLVLHLLAATACGHGEREQQCGGALHNYSGIQGS